MYVLLLFVVILMFLLGGGGDCGVCVFRLSVIVPVLVLCVWCC